MTCEQQGDPLEALRCYEAALALAPELAHAHFNRGTILLDSGDAEGALAALQKAVQLRPESAGTHFNLGAAYVRLDRPSEAVQAYRQALAFRPDFPEAMMALGAALEELGRDEEAVQSYGRALTMKPDYPEADRKLATLLTRLERLEEAAACYQRLLVFDPGNADLLNHLGALQKKLRQLDAAAASFRQVLAIQPDDALAHNNLAVVLRGLGQLEAAVESYRRALEAKPGFIEAHHNLGNAYMDLGETEMALSSYRSALAINPTFAESLTCMGVALQSLSRFDEALACHRQALALKPDHAQTHSNLGIVLQEMGQFEEALVSTRRALALQPDFSEAHNSLLFLHNYLSDQPPDQLLEEARRYGDMVARQARPHTHWDNTPEPARALRVGLVSGDFCTHPVGYFLEGVLQALANSDARLELWAYPTRRCDDDTSRRLRACCHGWHPVVGLSDEDVAAQIRQDGIDILIDLSGHTAHNRLAVFAWKPAPVQVSWLGYFATTGVAAIDYLIADPWTLPPGEEQHFTEKIWRLPETRLCFTPPRASPDVSALPALANQHITFGCFNNLSKMNDAVVALWARVLNAVPGSRLFLKARQLMDAATRQEVEQRFRGHGIGAERLVMEHYVPRDNYLRAYHRIDIALDPFPYPGGTTSAEALWMGVPVLTLEGERFLSRQGVGLLMNAGLQDWVAVDMDDYVARAVSHASDLQRLSVLRARLRGQVQASPIFNAPRFAMHFEVALRGMWQAWCEQRNVRTAAL